MTSARGAMVGGSGLNTLFAGKAMGPRMTPGSLWLTLTAVWLLTLRLHITRPVSQQCKLAAYGVPRVVAVDSCVAWLLCRLLVVASVDVAPCEGGHDVMMKLSYGVQLTSQSVSYVVKA